jgi:3-dehydroquinate synthase
MPPPSSTETTQLFFGCGLLQSKELLDFCLSFDKEIVIIADEKLETLYAKPLAGLLQAKLILIKGSESSKTRKMKEKLEDLLLKEGYGRNTLFIALGGGTLTDLVGFLASTYLRGVPLILIPTTLLAMVDAAIGGKTAVNTSYGKNLIGTLYHPKAVFIDSATLSSLPLQEHKNGLAEILKMGLIAKPDLLKPAPIETLISGAVQGKIEIVEQDMEELGLRRILNFGHTIAHGLEQVSSFTFPHGMAVAIGCIIESHLSMQLGFLANEDFEQIVSFYAPLHPLKLPEGYTRKAFLKALSFDKKNLKKTPRFVLLQGIGRPLNFEGDYCLAVSTNKLEPSLAFMEKVYG